MTHVARLLDVTGQSVTAGRTLRNASLAPEDCERRSDQCAMPWKCPACQEAIQHRSHEDRPRLRVHYRCHICRLELVFDPGTGRLIVAPFDEEDRKHPGPRRRLP
jgi:hypothetical protein